MKKEETPWSKGILLVCTKCHKAIEPSLLSLEGNCADNLKMYLKKSLKEKGSESFVRVVTSSCLDVCVKDAQALSYVGRDGTTESWTVHPEKEKEAVLDYIQAKCQK